ncbi:pathogenesis-related homeodomain protein-like [Salvia splendens]|uniref:pathogenesis-related homeodomain protein-like n=1 Tax=Salvia splendens TaxID=180675 RepID=UPI001C271328|nr:pathogenesis-related homeodomain protein-like [Salvia splendens]XP_042049853.1 pathogenesis-related homeodomain protein-like [Salvia splendens]
MPGAAKSTRKKLNVEDDERTLESLKRELKPQNKGHSSKSKSKAREIKSGIKVHSSLSKCKSKSSGKDDGNVSFKRRKVVKKTILNRTKTFKKQPSFGGPKDKSTNANKANDKDANSRKSKRRKKKKKNNVELDEASRLQRRTRYLLIKVKLEQNLIDAYSAEGWKGQSREKIKPEKELQRAKQQILKCKLGIREAIHQLDLLSSDGRINDAAVAPDGSMHHEHIICAKCKLREDLPDNDIILCDGTCNRAFHQECMDPPLSTENIPPGDEGWFCKFCKKKTEILEATNAHLGTHFPLDSSWQDVFKDEAALPDGANSVLFQEEEWPSDDSEDDDYDPDRNECSCSGNTSTSESDASRCSSSFLGSLEDEDGRFEVRSNRSFDETLELTGGDSDEIQNGEVVSHPRQRAAVDYIKLYNEMFGKNATESEQISEDEDWGPTKKKRKTTETNAASTLITLGETDNKFCVEALSDLKEKQLTEKMKRPIFRLPHDAVEKLRLVFAENELPERALRVSLSKQLGLEFEKVNKWFKNARYLALKSRKQTGSAEVPVSPGIQKESSSDTKEGVWDQIQSRNNTASAKTKVSKGILQRRNTHLLNHSNKIKQRRKPLLQSSGRNQMSVDPGDDVSLKHLRDKAKEAKKKLNSKSRGCMLESEAKMKLLCEIKSRIEILHRRLLELPCSRLGKAKGNNSGDCSVLFVPIAELKEKM